MISSFLLFSTALSTLSILIINEAALVNLETANEVLSDPFPAQIFSAYNGRHPGSIVGGRWLSARGAARMNDNEEVQRHFGRLISTTTQNYNIGVIQVKLSNWTDYPFFTASTWSPELLSHAQARSSFNPQRRQSRLLGRDENDGNINYWQQHNNTNSTENSSTYIFQTGNPKGRSRLAHVDNTYAYILIAVFLGLVIFLMSLYLCISCRSFCKKRARRRQPITFPNPYAYYESNPWGADRRGGDLERLFRSDLEIKRPPLIAPPPPPPQVPPPPIPQHLRPHPAYTRRKFVPPPPNRDSPVEREIRLQMLKRQISESTLSTRTRTNSF